MQSDAEREILMSTEEGSEQTQVSYLHCLKEATVWRAGWHFHTETLSSDTERGVRRRKSVRERERKREGGTDWQGKCKRGKRERRGDRRRRAEETVSVCVCERLLVLPGAL